MAVPSEADYIWIHDFFINYDCSLCFYWDAMVATVSNAKMVSMVLTAPENRLFRKNAVVQGANKRVS